MKYALNIFQCSHRLIYIFQKNFWNAELLNLQINIIFFIQRNEKIMFFFYKIFLLRNYFYFSYIPIADDVEHVTSFDGRTSALLFNLTNKYTPVPTISVATSDNNNPANRCRY